MHTLNRQNRQVGFTLIEILITLFIISIGMLGVAALQLSAKNNNFESIQRTTATAVAREMINKLRSNPQQTLAYVNKTVTPAAMVEPSPKCIATDPCTDAQRAAHDLWEFHEMLVGASELKGGVAVGGLVTPTGCITGPVAGGTGLYFVTVVWRGVVSTSNPTSNVCGTSSGLYGTSNEYRRSLNVPVFIAVNTGGV